MIVEYIPHRRRNGTRLGDETMHRWFAFHGYAAVRVDIAGMGDYTGGCLNEENMEWGACLFTVNGFPPDPTIVIGANPPFEHRMYHRLFSGSVSSPE